MAARSLPQKRIEGGRALHHLGHGRVLRVQDAQGIGLQASLGVFIEQARMAREVLDQGRAVGEPLLGAAQGVQLQLRPVCWCNAEAIPETPDHEQLLGIDLGLGHAQGFHAKLIELPIAALLRTLVAKHGAEVPQPPWAVVE